MVLARENSRILEAQQDQSSSESRRYPQRVPVHILHLIPGEPADHQGPVPPLAPALAESEPDSNPEPPSAAHTAPEQRSMLATLLQSWPLLLDFVVEPQPQPQVERWRDLLRLQEQQHRVDSVADSIGPMPQRRPLAVLAVLEVQRNQGRQGFLGRAELDTVLHQELGTRNLMRDGLDPVSVRTLRGDQ